MFKKQTNCCGTHVRDINRRKNYIHNKKKVSDIVFVNSLENTLSNKQYNKEYIRKTTYFNNNKFHNFLSQKI